ncbi:hypothetical protein PoB_001790600 [Plakobranchus ocellatus]|uniref:Uncharacterized protein n=1 Tax=Plakobranchus ocellatus TaxID=259542 RepID=A0AAV3YWB4_9GAST|nr:hypothetical protein PoB_001790600 [Plakobranchus ocellatus]
MDGWMDGWMDGGREDRIVGGKVGSKPPLTSAETPRLEPRLQRPGPTIANEILRWRCGRAILKSQTTSAK